MILQKKSLSKEKGDLNDAFPEDTGNRMEGEKKLCWNLPQILICWNIRTAPTSVTERNE